MKLNVARCKRIYLKQSILKIFLWIIILSCDHIVDYIDDNFANATSIRFTHFYFQFLFNFFFFFI